ncbi:phosphatase PAP2 family protein [Janthinobacterium sp. HLX7-2]|uniref:phosphatase PAP2 family protein n=1 Tax=Janthinobacterium sp. HLX7-2 TaxID=1259331 RepID=UPI003F22C87C
MLATLKLLKTPKGIDSALMLSAMLIIGIGNYSNFDLTLADSMFDSARGQFSVNANALTGSFQSGMTMLAAAAILLAIWDTLRPLHWCVSHRTALRVLALSAMLVPLSIDLLSTFSGVLCPGDLLRYGGLEPYARLLETAPAHASATVCLPATQASHAWCLLALPLFFWPRQPRLAALAAGVMLLCGLGVGWLQQMQGAQFFTHTLWSAWIASFFVYLLYQLLKADDALA